MLKTKNVEGHPRKTQITSVMFNDFMCALFSWAYSHVV